MQTPSASAKTGEAVAARRCTDSIARYSCNNCSPGRAACGSSRSVSAIALTSPPAQKWRSESSEPPRRMTTSAGSLATISPMLRAMSAPQAFSALGRVNCKTPMPPSALHATCSEGRLSACKSFWELGRNMPARTLACAAWRTTSAAVGYGCIVPARSAAVKPFCMQRVTSERWSPALWPTTVAPRILPVSVETCSAAKPSRSSSHLLRSTSAAWRVKVSKAAPAARSSAAVRPTAATSGSVYVARGTSNR
mmetsp:Transcript_31902/g.80659  ORF Transcript_31902/g.80659 Transcript_31902/m.80659 type:complete len:251 (-) Transcript_31902:290-1042(-)